MGPIMVCMYIMVVLLIKSGAIFQQSRLMKSSSLQRLSAATLVEPEEVIKPAKTFSIRAADYMDLQGVVDLRLDVFYPELRTVKSFHEKILTKMAQRRETGAECLVAIQDGSIIGTIEFSPSDFKDTTMENIGYKRKLYLMDLAVVPRARRMGVASLLLKRVEEYAIEHNYRDVYLHVEVDNDKARNLYLKNGFREVLPLDWAINFTEKRLHKPWEHYVLLFKQIW